MGNKAALSRIADPKFKELCETLLGEMKRLKIPGVAVGVFHDGDEHTAGLGVTSVENPLPVTPDTLFQTGSISKTFTGTILMRLTEVSQVELNAPVRVEERSAPRIERRIVLKDLDCHLDVVDR